MERLPFLRSFPHMCKVSTPITRPGNFSLPILFRTPISREVLQGPRLSLMIEQAVHDHADFFPHLLLLYQNAHRL